MLINPEYINELVDFNATNQPWKYNPNGLDMRNLQIQGSARVFNLLEEKKLALLADEVGMGKTIQALTICAALWQQKPDARVYILTPRDEIARNWLKEYQTFIKLHYRHKDDVVKTSYGDAPVHEMVYCKNLYDMVSEIKFGTARLFVGKVSSFSSLAAQKDVIGRLQNIQIKPSKWLIENKNKQQSLEYHCRVARHLKEEIVRLQGKQNHYFDLLIIDEAHYLRNRQGKSLRVGVASTIFGDPDQESDTPLAARVLLMTATPNHNSSADIGNIVRYFTKKYNDAEYFSILKDLCVRRLRRLASTGKNKYNYREEIESPSDFRENPLSEIFFAIYQQKLVKTLREQAQGDKHGRWGNSRMMKYLEGVEFIPDEDQLSQVKNKPDDDRGNDYETGQDAKILAELSRDFRNIFGTLPPHPKYQKLLEDLVETHQNWEKKVVFVRRIPSVFEISRRVTDHYDRKLWEWINPFVPSLKLEKLSRNSFQRLTMAGPETEAIEDEQDIIDESTEDKNIPSSRVLNLFKVVKSESPRSTKASNFRLRFTHTKSGPFTLLFSPGPEYDKNPYVGLKLYRFGAGQDENYYNSAVIDRCRRVGTGISMEIETQLVNKSIVEETPKRIEMTTLPTLFTIFWEILETDENLTQAEKKTLEDTYKSFTLFEKEALSNFIEKGTLLASEAIVQFFAIFLELQGESVELYTRFTERVRQELKGMRLYRQIMDSILLFRNIYQKVFSKSGDSELLKEPWEQFKNAQPIYPYNADNKSQNVLNCFNTPFYPDMLVATTVLQEGVNLQYFCDNMYHYGMAWTPGDNEQRVGRIDRMFGKIERALESDDKARLRIFFPYLKDTIDEEHLARFVRKKYKEELLIDLGKSFSGKDIDIQTDMNPESWRAFLRKPENTMIADPFPVSAHSFTGIKTKFVSKPAHSPEPFFNSIRHALKEIEDLPLDIYVLDHQDGSKLLVNPHLANGRKQPVFIEFAYDPAARSLMGHVAYSLVMKTPLHAINQLKHFHAQLTDKDILSHYGPGLKLCLDRSENPSSHMGIYLCAELPLFITDLSANPLSTLEIQETFINLANCADLIESKIFGNRDLTLESLNIRVNEQYSGGPHRLRAGGGNNSLHGWTRSGPYLACHRPIQLGNTISDLKFALSVNHEYRYIKCFQNERSWQLQVAHLLTDAQQEELMLMKKHLEVAFERLQREMQQSDQD